MKKRFTFALFLFSLTSLFGCTNVIKLTDEENRAIAEYSADLLLKYASGYDSKYFDGEKEMEEITAEDSTEPVAQATDEPAPASTEQDTEATTEQTVNYETDIAGLLGLQDISILYNNYQIVDKYPSMDGSGEYIYMDAPEGMKLILVEFDMKNLTANPVDVNLLSMDVDYLILMNETKTAKPILTILMNDLSTYEAALAPDASEKAVLVFQILDSMVDQIQTLDIKVSYGGKQGMIKVK